MNLLGGSGMQPPYQSTVSWKGLPKALREEGTWARSPQSHAQVPAAVNPLGGWDSSGWEPAARRWQPSAWLLD